MQPLARIDDAGERAWAAEWVATLLAREAVTITPELKEHLWSALTSLASAPVAERTLTGLSVLLQSNALKQALQPYTVAGPWGRLLDAETERLGEAEVQAFETEGLIGAGAAPAVLSYLFHRIEDRFDGRPTLLIIDEGWLALDDRGFAGQLREWLKTLRKKNASVIFATQSLADIDGSAIAPAIIESCPTRCSCRTSARSNRRSRPSIAASGSTTARSRSSAARRRSATTTASRAAATACSSSASPRSRSPSPPPPPRPTRPPSPRSSPPTAATASPRHGCAARASIGRPTCSSPDPGGLPMTTRRFRAALAAGVAALTLVTAGVPAHAQWIVFDPTNFSQNVLTAARELQQVNNEIQSLENQANMLINQARNLASLPYSSLAQLEQSINQTEQLLTQAQRIAYNVTTINQAFTQTYPQAYSSSTSSQQLVADAQTRWQNSLAGFQDAMRVQAGVVQNLDSTRTQIDALVSSSQSATGALQAAQSGNQLVALQTKQLADLTAVMAAIARAQSLEGARTVENQAQAQQQLSNFLNYGPGYQPGSAQMFH